MFHAFSRYEAQAAIERERMRREPLVEDEHARSLQDRIGLYLRWGMRERAAECRFELGTIPGEFPGPLPDPPLRRDEFEFGAGRDAPPMDAEAVREAEARVRAGQHRHIWAGLHAVGADRAQANAAI